MDTKSRKIQAKKELFLFFCISFIWMWGLNIVKFLASRNVISIPDFVYGSIGYIAAFAPFIASIVLTKVFNGQENLKFFLKSGWKIDFNKKWIIAIVLLFPINAIITIAIMQMFHLTILWEYSLPLVMIVPIGIIIWLLGAYPEEYGWRGYAQPRLNSLFANQKTTLILGIIWAFWHFPLHFIPGTTQFNIPFWQYGLQTIVLTVYYSYFFIKTKGSIFAASLFHALGNIIGALIPSWATSQGRWISFVILLVPAIYIYFFELKDVN